MNQTRGQFSGASGSSTAKRSFFSRSWVDGPVDDFLLSLCPGFLRLAHQLQGVAVELGEEGEPPPAHGPHLVIDGVPPGDSLRPLCRVEPGLVGGALVAPLVAVDVVEGGGVLEARRSAPVEGPHQGRPGGDGGELLLADVVVQTAAVFPDAAAQHQRRDAGPVGEVAVIPVVDPGADDDRAFPFGALGGCGPLPGELEDGGPVDASEALLPGRGVRGFGIVVAFRVVAGQIPPDTELGHQQIEDGGDGNFSPLGFDQSHRHAAPHRPVGGKIGKGDLAGAVVLLQEGKSRRQLRTVEAVLHLQVPLPFFLLPAKTEGAQGHAGAVARLIPDEELGAGVFRLPVAREPPGVEQAAGGPGPLLFLQLDQKGAVGVAFEIIEKVWGLRPVVELAEDDVVDGQPEGPVLAGVGGNPPVGVLGDHTEVGGEDHHLATVVPGLCDEMDVRGAGHAQIGAHHRDVLAVVPVGALGDVGLLPPDLGGGVGQVAVPVVETQVHPAEQLQEAGSGGEAEHRHGGDGGEADHSVGAVLFDRVEGRGGDDLQHLVPVRPAKAALAPGLLVAAAAPLVLDQGGPGRQGIAVLRLRLPPQVHEPAAQVRVFYPQGTVDVPGSGDPPLAAAGLVGGQFRIEPRVVGGLKLPDDDAVLDVHVPGAAAGAVNSMGAAHHLFVLEAVAVEFLPVPLFRIDDILDPAHRASPFRL